MAEVFISYKQEEKDWVDRLATALASWGLTVWYDSELLGGSQFRQIIDENLARAKCVVVCWSQLSTKSPWVTAEAEHGFQADKLVPLYVDNCNPPMPFNVLHTIDMIGWSGDREAEPLIQLVQAIAAKVHRSDVLDAVHHHLAAQRPAADPALDISAPRSQTYSFRDMADLLDEMRPDVQTFDPDVMVCFDARGGLWAELIMDNLSQRIPILVGLRVLARGQRKTDSIFAQFPLLQSSRWNLYVPPALALVSRETKVLYVDDYSRTGETCQLIRRHLEQQLSIPAANIRTFTLITSPEAERLGQLPDFYGVKTAIRPRLFYMSIR